MEHREHSKSFGDFHPDALPFAQRRSGDQWQHEGQCQLSANMSVFFFFYVWLLVVLNIFVYFPTGIISVKI